MTDSPDVADDDSLDFTPAPAGARHDDWTAKRQRLRRNAGAPWRRRRRCPRGRHDAAVREPPAQTVRRRQFRACVDAALEEGRIRARDEALRRGTESHSVPIRRNGRIVGHRHAFDNRLLFAACYGEPPSRFQRR